MAVVFFAVAVIVDAVVGDRGLLTMLRAREEYDAANAALARQRTENDTLRETISRLTNDPAAIEEIARDELGLMRRRHASINDLPITDAERKFHWPLGRRPDDHPGLGDLGL